MVALNSVGYATVEYTGSTVEESDEDDEEEEGVSQQHRTRVSKVKKR